jgi:hypothetical protein
MGLKIFDFEMVEMNCQWQGIVDRAGEISLTLKTNKYVEW